MGDPPARTPEDAGAGYRRDQQPSQPGPPPCQTENANFKDLTPYDEDEINLLDLGRVIWKRRRLIGYIAAAMVSRTVVSPFHDEYLSVRGGDHAGCRQGGGRGGRSGGAAGRPVWRVGRDCDAGLHIDPGDRQPSEIQCVAGEGYRAAQTAAGAFRRRMGCGEEALEGGRGRIPYKPESHFLGLQPSCLGAAASPAQHRQKEAGNSRRLGRHSGPG